MRDRYAAPTGPTPLPAIAPARLDRRRYRRIRRVFLSIGLHILFWDVFLARPGLARFRTPPLPRWQKLARDYRLFAVEMGGVLIKVGQFLAARVDLLPAEITDELAELQDEVPAAPIEAVLAQIEADFGTSVSSLFTSVSPVALGAASLAQVHQATLPGGEEVVVKVLRPGIMTLVETDLAGIRAALRSLKRFKSMRKQVDLDWLLREFTTVTRRELDLQAEGRSAERFAGDFAADPGIRAPRICWEHSAAHTLTMENVAFIRIDDRASIADAGISPAQVAARLFDCYLEQILIKQFVHADPHAGNLFVKPLPAPVEARSRDSLADGAARDCPGRPFQLVFVDFGMAVEVPRRLRSPIRHYILGIATQDTHLIVQAYRESGVLLPGADMRMVEELTNQMLEQMGGAFLGQVKSADLQQYFEIFERYRAFLLQSPFQFPADLLFIFRALGILSGVIAGLDPEFDPVSRITPFARRVMREEYRPDLDDVLRTALKLLRLPARLDDVLTRLQQGQIAGGTAAPAASVDALARSVNRLAWWVTGSGLLIAGIWTRSAGWEGWTGMVLVIAACMALLGGVLAGRPR